ncbi:MAG: 3-isopropylmalate dehydratase [Rhodospirillaceae bacterium]|nr:3-isopropylmalate dehydratase [Rhodospirillaceae bacterium]MCY4239015.1 3-isopropylmalate dehydratase [Rhodospirillaceae bacterium]MCY4311181.1 3-isopropylmalate dehydratase [Rhodospirillaceae bacterium]
MSDARAWCFGDDVDTDILAPGLYMKGGIESLAAHCLETLDPDFAADLQPGDIIVAGCNFGMGSSREQAVMALNHLNVGAVVAESFARIFFRNAINLALPVVTCAEARSIAPGDRLCLDPARGVLENRTQHRVLACEPIPAHLLVMIADGGLLPHLKKKLKARVA